MLMVSSSQGRPPDFELLSVLCLCRPVWHVSLPRKNILEELIFHMGLGTKIPQIVDGSLHDGCFSAGQQNWQSAQLERPAASQDAIRGCSHVASKRQYPRHSKKPGAVAQAVFSDLFTNIAYTCSRRVYVVRPIRASQGWLSVPHALLAMACAWLSGFTQPKTTLCAAEGASKNKIACGITIIVLFCSTTLNLSALAPLKVFRPPQFSMTCLSKLLSAVTESASLSLDYWMHSLRLSTCEGPTEVSESTSRN